MNTVTRLALFGAGLVLAFGVTFFAGRALVPDDTVATWTREAEKAGGEHDSMEASDGEGHDANGDHDSAAPGDTRVRGLSIEQDGYRLSEVQAPGRAGEPGQISFQVFDPDDEPLTEFAVNHEKQLHLIAVRSDGAGFRHLHPHLDSRTGVWSVPMAWQQGGSYRLFADFVPADAEAASAVTLGHNVEVDGEFTPVDKPVSRTDSVDGFDLTIGGDLRAGESDDLTVTVTRDGAPETHLEPYLGAFGHLVALREGDLAYLHVHADESHGSSEVGGETAAGEDGHGHGSQLAGPGIGFVAEAPTPGRYLLYLDFKVDGQVHTAEFVLEAK